MKEIASKQSKGQGQDLGSVVRYSFLKTALIPILTVELLLLCLYFFGSSYLTEKNLELLKSNAFETVSEISKSEAKYFDDQLKEISRNNRSLQVEHQALFGNATASFKAIASFYKEKNFINDKNEESINVDDSSVFVSSNTRLGPEISEKIIKTEAMNLRFKTLVDNNPNLVAAYFTSWDNVARIYPKIDDFYDKIPYDFDLTEYNFYYRADAMHNPDRTSVWTNAYLDPAGKGWMLSSLTPIYKNKFLEGVTGLDVTLSTFSKHILSNGLQWDSGALVLDKHGNILTMSRAAESYLGLRDFSNFNLKDYPEGRTLIQPTEFNLLKLNTMEGMYFSEFFNGSDQTMEFPMHGEEYLLTKQVIPETGWQLFILAPLKNVYAPILAEKEQIIRVGLTFLALAGIFYALFFVYLRHSAKVLANRITAPIAQVSNMIVSYDTGNEAHEFHEPVNITELDNLLSMNFKIQKAKVRYEKISQEMTVKNEQLKTLAITDTLTQLYNRLKLDEVLGYEVARARRDGTSLCVAIIDIDKFKLVNDTFGHQLGDSVLIGVAQTMLKNIRSTDILGRWGGEEFMLILPNTSLDSASVHANKLRQLVQNTSFKPVHKITISVGLASCMQLSCQIDLVERADNALYEAKETGRNRVVLAPLVAFESEKIPEAISLVS